MKAQIDPVVASLVADIDCQPEATAPVDTTEVPAAAETTGAGEVDDDGNSANDDEPEGGHRDNEDKDRDKDKGAGKDPHNNGHGNDDNKGKQ